VRRRFGECKHWHLNVMGFGHPRPPVSLQWRIRCESGTLKITDVVIDGISMAVTDRQQFSDIIQHGGGTIMSLIDALRPRT
jgi:phospholipid transport system substrate-binding protein